ncbi:MAG: methylmalonyl Co-A mutase-associated GTPase MeaB [Cyclobacteriaceae bacterium]|nr:methylmalonyl Co-A mutase-associated GTPase MeaB [Cyclobacteriaceae bacterium]
MKARLTADEYIQGIRNGDRVILAKAITVAESYLPADYGLMEQILDAILPQTGKSLRIGITGVPGVGKSTFIETFGNFLINHFRYKIAILTVDPSSQITHGSILGDKTRMEELSRNPNAFIRPSASGEALGGITHRTRESILLCEAAGFDVILVETVGIGQSETAVKNTVDAFLLLMLAGAGDELQGIKKGIIEMADLIAITKADGDNTKKARAAQLEYQHALHFLRADESGWRAKVLTCSAVSKTGIDTIWENLQQYLQVQHDTGHHTLKRQRQEVQWFHECLDSMVKRKLTEYSSLSELLADCEKQVREKSMSAPKAARIVLNEFFQQLKTN